MRRGWLSNIALLKIGRQSWVARLFRTSENRGSPAAVLSQRPSYRRFINAKELLLKLLLIKAERHDFDVEDRISIGWAAVAILFVGHQVGNSVFDPF